MAEFLGDHFLLFATVSRSWGESWGQDRPKTTRWVTSDSTTVPLLVDGFEPACRATAPVCAAPWQASAG